MKQLWFDYNQKFLQLSSREQVLLLLSGLAIIFFIMSFVFIDQQQANMIKFDKQIQTMHSHYAINYHKFEITKWFKFGNFQITNRMTN